MASIGSSTQKPIHITPIDFPDLPLKTRLALKLPEIILVKNYLNPESQKLIDAGPDEILSDLNVMKILLAVSKITDLVSSKLCETNRIQISLDRAMTPADLSDRIAALYREGGVPDFYGRPFEIHTIMAMLLCQYGAIFINDEGKPVCCFLAEYK